MYNFRTVFVLRPRINLTARNNLSVLTKLTKIQLCGLSTLNHLGITVESICSVGLMCYVEFMCYNACTFYVLCNLSTPFKFD